MADCPLQPLPADSGAMWDSITNRVFSLPDETALFHSHTRRARAVSTLLEQRRWYPWFTGLTRDGFLAQIARLATSDPGASTVSLPVPP